MLATQFSGCDFTRGVDVEPQAYLRLNPTALANRTFSLRAVQWHTGNMHMPFHFTVYRYPREYEIRVSAPNETVNTGALTADQFEVFPCGRKIESVTGTLLLSDRMLTVHIQHPSVVGSKIIDEVDVHAKIIATEPPPRSLSDSSDRCEPRGKTRTVFPAFPPAQSISLKSDRLLANVLENRSTAISMPVETDIDPADTSQRQ
ncbi:MAG TPA: hypothetical protein PK318_02180 [Accumulibacter sp.]|nr:hypothetical protein [Accumulibacter sp.]